MSNTFNAAKIIGADDKRFQIQYNMLIDLLQEQIQVLSATVGSGLVLSGGVLSVGNELSALQLLADTAGFLKKVSDGVYSIDTTSYQPLNNELSALSALADTAGFVKKTGDGAYSIDTSTYSTVDASIVYAIALG